MSLLHMMFQRLNNRFWGGRLPTPILEYVKEIRADGAKRHRLAGATIFPVLGPNGPEYKIQILKGLDHTSRLITLAHEMCHIAVWPHSHKSKAWKKEVKRLGEEGLLELVF